MNPQTEISILKIEKQIAELEANWLRQQNDLNIHGRSKYSMPKIAKITMLFGVLILAFFTILALFSRPLVSGSSLIIEMVIILASVFIVYQNYQKAEYDEDEKVKYEERRERLLLEIQKLKSKV